MPLWDRGVRQEDRMTAKIISGKEIAAEIQQELKAEVAALKNTHDIVPGLVTILVGDNPASVSYVTGKQRTARELGFHSVQDIQPSDISEEKLLQIINGYNNDPSIHGILVQLPLPKHINESQVLYAINPDKDVDGFHPVNVGRLMIGDARFYPCTPYGIQQMLIRSGVPIEGAEVVVVGRSNLVGKPIAMMLVQKKKDANATVTICHTGTKNLRPTHPQGGHPDRRGRHAERRDRGHGEGRRGRHRRGGQPDRHDPRRQGHPQGRCGF